MRKWEFDEARDRLTELVRLAEDGEPQLVAHDGRDAVVVLSAEEYARLAAPETLVDFMRRSPLAEVLAEGELELSHPLD